MEIRPKDILPDPVLTGFSVQYGMGDVGMAVDALAPLYSSTEENFKFPTYKADALDQDVKVEVAAGDKPNKIKRRLPTFTSKAIPRRALDDELPDQAAATGRGPLVRQANRVKTLTHKLKVYSEKKFKALLDAAGTGVDITATSVAWNAASNVVIEKNLDDAQEAFLLACGEPATHAIFPRIVANVAKRDPAIRALRKRTDESLLIDGSLPPEVFGLNVYIPGALNNTAAPGIAQTINRIWNDDTVYLIRVDPNFGGDGETMTSVGRAVWSKFGTPYAAYTWPDPHQSKRTTWVSVEAFLLEWTVCSDAVYRLTNVL